MPEQLGARQSDIWRPLFAIADEIGGRWPAVAREAACSLHGVSEDEGDNGLLMLADVRALFSQSGETRLSSAFIADELAKLDDRPWPEYRNGKPITTSGVAHLFKRFHVKSRNMRIRGEVVKGYDVDTLRPIFLSYLPAGDSAATGATSDCVAPVAGESKMVIERQASLM
jgi:hypothetical protein